MPRVRPTPARIETARLGAIADLKLLGLDWTQEDQDDFDVEVKAAIQKQLWQSTEDIKEYIFAMFCPQDQLVGGGGEADVP